MNARLAPRRRLPVASLLALALAAGACSSTPTVVPSRDLNRPTDMAFACIGAFDSGAGDGSLVFSGRPVDWCQPFSATVPAEDDQHHFFAFLPNSDSGELTVVDGNAWKLVDLDPSVSGYSRLPLGVLPEQISASDDGCRLVTANSGSCDFSVVNPALLLAPVIKPGMTGAPPGGTVTPEQIVVNVPPITDNGQLLAAPQEIQFLPQDTGQLTGSDNLCSGDTTYGVQPSSTSGPTLTTGWRALVTFPTCDLIATIELPSGQILDSAYVRAAGNGTLALVPAGRTPQCAADCGTVDRTRTTPDGGATADGGGIAADAGSTTDAGSTADGGTTTIAPGPVPLGPSAIAIVPPAAAGYGIHAYVSLSNASQIVSLDVSTDGLITGGANGAFIPLENAVGSNRIRLSVNPYVRDPSMKVMGRFAENLMDPSAAHLDRHYLYVVARDGSLRVVDVATQPETECETNIDPQNPPANYDPQAACTPVTASSPGNRRPFAVGPGIRLPAVPIDIAAADTRDSNPSPGANTPDNTVRELSLSGTYAWIATSSGTIYLMNIDPVQRSIWTIPADAGPTVTLGTSGSSSCVDGATPCDVEPLPPANTLRNANVRTFSRALDPSDGPARLDLPPVIPSSGPRIATTWTRGTPDNPTTIAGGSNVPTYTWFADPAGVTAQTWTASWQGPLFAGPRFTGQVQGGTTVLQDPGFSFCGAGTQVGDLVTFTGCVDDNQCGAGRTCIHGPGTTQAAGGLTVNGVCVDPTMAGPLAQQCESELTTVRRYLISDLTDHAVTLVPHPDELAFSNLRSCTDLHPAPATDGGAPAAADGGAAAEADCSDPTDSTTTPFRCVDVTSAAIPSFTGTRCLERCTMPLSTMECRVGRICVPYGSASDCSQNNCFCADAPPLTADPNSCGFDQLVAYQVNAGRAFVVNGSATSLPTARQVNNGQCGGPVSSNHLAVSRISMDADASTMCTSPADALTALATTDIMPAPLPNGMPHVGTQCLSTDDLSLCPGSTDLFKVLQTTPSPNPCLFVSGANESDVVGDTTVRHVNALFRNTEVAFVMTNLERAPSLPQDIIFSVHGGFRPETVFVPATVEVSMPARILVGATLTSTPAFPDVPYLFVVDQRALGRGQAGGPTRGQLLRIHPLGLPDSNGAFQPWFEDFAHSNNEFPIR